MKTHVFEAFSYLQNEKHVFYRQEVFFMFKKSKAHFESISSLQHEKHLKTLQKCAFDFSNMKKPTKKAYFFACSKAENASKT